VLFASCFLLFGISISPVFAAEPSLTEVLSYLGFTNIVESTIETFPAGAYNITLYAEFAAYRDENVLSGYKVGTNTYTTFFTGSEGGSGYLSSPIIKTVTFSEAFGLSFLSPGPCRYCTQTSMNPDGVQHVKVYRNSVDPSMYLVGFEDLYEGGDLDYQDMVLSLQLQHYLKIVSPYGVPGGGGWHYNGTTVCAHLADGIVDHGNETRRIFTYWSGDASGTSCAESNPILMNQNKTATANWKTRYYLNVQTNPSDLVAIGGTGWHDKNENIMLTAPSVSGYNFGYWDVDETSKGEGIASISVLMDRPHIATAHYVQSVTYALTITATFGGTTMPPPGVYTYASGSTVQVSPMPNAKYMFSHWELDGVNIGSPVPYTVMMNDNHNLKAVFRAIPVGGYSFSTMRYLFPQHAATYGALLVLSCFTLSLEKRKRK
jgi:hypothetical protein